MKQSDERKQHKIEVVAYHEAGHAVMAVLTHTPLRDTTIVGSRVGASSGATRLMERAGGNKKSGAIGKLGPRRQREILQRACFDVAGEIAQRRFARNSWRKPHSRTDVANVSSLLETLRLSEKRLKALAKAIVARADSLIRANWSRVEAVASELLKHGTLTGSQVRRIVARTAVPRAR
jgi:ATP-dependent Zn protease